LRDSRLILLNITPHFDYFSADKKEHEYMKKRHALQSHVTSSYRHSTLTMLIKCHSLVKAANQHGHGTPKCNQLSCVHCRTLWLSNGGEVISMQISFNL